MSTVAVLVVGLGIGVLTQGGAGSAPRPVRLRLVWEGRRPGVLGMPTVVVATADGSGAHVIGAGELPQVSPDGRWLSTIVLGREIDLRFTPLGDGRPWRVRLPGATGVLAVAWVPDSRSVAVSWLAAGDVWSFAVVPARPGAVPAVLTHRPAAAIAASPDGTRLAFSACVPQRCSIDTIRVEGGRVTPLAVADAPSVLWSPRGILYSHGGQVWTASLDGTLRRQLTHLPTGVVPVAVSADGSRLVAR